MSPEFRTLPTEVDESRMEQSYNALIPGSVIAQGVDLEIRLDLDGLVPATPESRLRIPAAGRERLDVRALPRLDLVVVPIVGPFDPGGEIRKWTRDLAPDSEELGVVRSVLPVADMAVKVHDGFVTTADLATGTGWGELLAEIVFLRIREGGRGYYYGAVQLGEDAIWNGLAQIGYGASVGRPDPTTLAHELGHNMGLRHAPCGGAGGPDAAYPYDGGAIGVWGYDFARRRVVNASLYKDVMSYCGPEWISDFHFSRAMGHRLFQEAPAAGGLAADALGRAPGDAGALAPGAHDQTTRDPTMHDQTTRDPTMHDQTTRDPTMDDQPTLLLWGRAGVGDLALDPAFMVDAPASMPTRAGPYRLEGLGPRGERRFAFDFAPTPLEHGGGNFVFTVPFDPERDGALARVVLSGPEGSRTLERAGSAPMAMVVDRRSGELRAVLRDWDGAWPRALPLDERHGTVVVSEGLPPAGPSF